MIRLAKEKDINAVAETYRELLEFEEQNGSNSNWKLNVYPTIDVPMCQVPTRTMYVLEENEEICASMVLNSDQAPEYADIQWMFSATNSKVLVIHTLCIPPKKFGNGYGRKMVEFAKDYAKKHNYAVIRIDTYAHNEPAKNLYLNNGFRVAGYGTILLHGLIEKEQIYLETKI